MWASLIISGLYVHTVTETKLVVDTSRGEQLRINVIYLQNWNLSYLFIYVVHTSKDLFSFLRFVACIHISCSVIRSSFTILSLKMLLDLHLDVHIFNVQFDVTFPALPCSVLSLDAMDISGEQHLDVVCYPKLCCEWLLLPFKIHI